MARGLATGPSPSRRAGTSSAAFSALLLSAQLALAGTAPPPPPNSTVNVNYVYAASLGFGGYTLAGLTANVYTLPINYTVGDTPMDGWSLRFMLPVQLGIYDFKAQVDGMRIGLSQQSISIVPGAELQIPVTDNLVFKPFAQFGEAHSFGVGGQNPDAWVYLAGARSVAQWRVDDYTLSLGNGIIYAGDNTVGPGFGEHYVALQIAGEIRRPLGFKIGEWAPDLGIFVADYYYPAPLQFSRFLKSPLRIANQNEVGFSIGSAKSRKILWFSNPRVGAGLVFGGGLTVYHINFGFPF
ncbi:MAG TPA: hypothetical protein VGM32_09425 [Rhodopila sp.]